MYDRFTPSLSLLFWCKVVSQFPCEPFSLYNSMLFGAQVETGIRLRVRGATVCVLSIIKILLLNETVFYWISFWNKKLYILSRLIWNGVFLSYLFKYLDFAFKFIQFPHQDSTRESCIYVLATKRNDKPKKTRKKKSLSFTNASRIC